MGTASMSCQKRAECSLRVTRYRGPYVVVVDLPRIVKRRQAQVRITVRLMLPRQCVGPSAADCPTRGRTLPPRVVT